MAASPRAEQLALPAAYGTPSRLLAWDEVVARLAGAMHYWLATVASGGRPHVVPLDGLWLDDAWYFGGAPATHWQANLRANPAATLHLEDAAAAVVVDGMCRIADVDRTRADELAAQSKTKYGYAPSADDYLTGVWVLCPVRAVAWTELPADATRFVFD